ncbi:matrix metalloproteinase-9 isoform X3 [Lepeophtheirus salmonis]|uniref:matrix metalloproteinase-9 isoform X3 n=1 Tax=Lepeophtheirus salmonis TaxID=72036 RepID=UPI001AEA440B|nr:matrix metalloproteinase-9-like isoform X3 [Lepeophtheirus salmonis]
MSIQHKKINKRRGIVPNLVPGKNIRDDCATTEGPSCIFPFQFMGEFHHDCMQISKTSSSFMCAIQVNTFGIAIQFGICNKSCPIKTTKLISTNPRTTSTTKTSINTSTDSTTNSTGCTTTNGEVCKFPFIYLGVTYNECTSIDNAGVFWCALSLYGTGEANVYGICGNNCQKTSTTVGKSTIQGCTTNGEVCKFPFIYSDVTYNECTSKENAGVLWCATSRYDTGEALDYGACGKSCRSQ